MSSSSPRQGSKTAIAAEYHGFFPAQLAEIAVSKSTLVCMPGAIDSYHSLASDLGFRQVRSQQPSTGVAPVMNRSKVAERSSSSDGRNPHFTMV
jgi:hypothetical protein